MRTWLSLMFFLYSLIGFSQETDEMVKLWTLYPGYIITWENDTISGYLKLNNLVHNQKKAIFYKSQHDTKPSIKYKPKEIRAYKVGPRFYESFKYHVPDQTKGYHFFLKVIEGPICYYKWFYEPAELQQQRVQLDEDDFANSSIDLSFSEAELSSYDFAKKSEGEFTHLSSFKFLTNFKKNMSKFVSDYPALSEKIANKEDGFGYYDKEKIIRQYNEWYLKSRN